MSEEKNLKIKDTLRATKERRSQMDCRVFSVKVQENRLSCAKEERLNRCFLEVKWLRNAVVATDSMSLEDTSNVQVKVNDHFETREISNLSSQMKQSVVDSVKTDVCNLSKAKKKGLKAGRLKFKHECNEINLKQFGNTYKIKSHNKISVQNIGVLVVNGLEQINLDEVEFANAKLIKKPSGFYIHLTVHYYENDEYFFRARYEDDMMSAVRAVCFGHYNYMDDYVRVNAYGNLDSKSSYDYKSDLMDSQEEIVEIYAEMLEDNSVSEFKHLFEETDDEE